MCGDAVCVGRKATCMRLSIIAEDERISPSHHRDWVYRRDGCDHALGMYFWQVVFIGFCLRNYYFAQNLKHQMLQSH